MITKGENFSRARLVNFKPQSGDVIESCNLAQLQPHTPVGLGVAGLTYRNCNLVNCDVDGIVEHCNTTQISRCGNLHDGYDCAVDCEHVTSSESISVDGVLIDTLYEYADKVVV